MKTLIVCVSVSHGNTRRIADAMAGILDATVVDPDEIDAAAVADYDLVGFGSGIFGMAFHPRLRAFVRALPPVHGTKTAFVFATRGGPQFTSRLYLPRMERFLGSKGFELVGAFSCLGFDTWFPLQLFGGANKGHPDVADLDAARAFAAGLTNRQRGVHHEYIGDTDALGAEKSPTIEVRAYRDGTLVHSEFCETEDEASLIVDEWSEEPGVTCEVDDLSVRHRADDVLAPEPAEQTIEYPSVYEQD